jgi:hypothetical protein
MFYTAHTSSLFIGQAIDYRKLCVTHINKIANKKSAASKETKYHSIDREKKCNKLIPWTLNDSQYYFPHAFGWLPDAPRHTLEYSLVIASPAL